MPTSRELPQEIPPSGNSLDAKAPSGQIFGANLRVCVGGGRGSWMELIPA